MLHLKFEVEILGNHIELPQFIDEVKKIPFLFSSCFLGLAVRIMLRCLELYLASGDGMCYSVAI